jgi:excisionase family DNA binding protein
MTTAASTPAGPVGAELYAGNKHLRAAEAAAIMQVSPKTISRWAKEGKLPFVRTLGGHRRYPETALRKLVADNTERAS